MSAALWRELWTCPAYTPSQGQRGGVGTGPAGACGTGPPARHRARQTMRGGQVRGSAWHVIQRTRRRPVRPAQGTLSPRQGGGVGTGPAAESGAGGLQTMHGGARWASHQCMARNTRDGPCARARQWLPHRQMRPSPGPSPRRCRAPVACNRPCIWSRCAFGWRVDPWVEESQVDGVRISPYTVSEHGVRHCDRATQTVHFKFGLFPGSFMQLNSSQAKTINRVVERVASTSTPAIERLIFPEAFLARIDSFPF